MAEPISQYVLKVHSRCDLACDHCYVYEHADQSWRAKPRVIAPRTADAAARRIAEHAMAHGLAEVSVVLHGGEPLLLGRPGMRDLLEVLKSRIAAVARLDLGVHSNGVLLDQQWCDLLSRYGVRIGISLDGDKAANDRHRRFTDGRSSHPQVLDALSLLRQPRYLHLYAGILCTVDLDNDPVAVYRALVDQRPPRLDLLLPHATWERPPRRPPDSGDPYADWLLRIYRCWDDDGRAIPIRIFDSLLSAANGGPSFTEALGTDPGRLLVIDTDGAWEQPDSMKTAFDGAAATGGNVADHSVDEACAHPAVAARQRGIGALCATCRSCEVVQICGGGLYAHRYRPAAATGSAAGRSARAHDPAEFENPSVYCADLKSLISQVLRAERRRGVPVIDAGSRTDHGTGASGPVHRFPVESLDIMAAGPGDIATISELAAIRLSRTREFVAAVAKLETDWRDGALRAAADAGWALLRELDREHPEAVQEVFAHPYTYAWAWRCLRPPADADRDLDRAHLANLAAAAAVHAGSPAELQVPVRHGQVHLPTVGAIAVRSGQDATRLLSVAPGRAPAVRGGDRLRRVLPVTTAPFQQLAVEDLDPFRDCQEWAAADRLSGSESQAWQRDLAAAGGHLAAAVPRYAQVLGQGLRLVVPLRPAATGSRSATAAHAFGAVAVALPGPRASRGELSELLLHEFQHVKLYALLDLYRLHNPGYRGLLRVPWRNDPRPVDGVLQGTYAYLALIHLRQAEGRPGRTRYLRYRSWVRQAISALHAADGALTPAGRRFVAGMEAAAESAGA